LRCDRLVKSSLASSIVGFIKGGNEGSLPFWRASIETSTVFDYIPGASVNFRVIMSLNFP
jgi:hypothetical protein